MKKMISSMLVVGMLLTTMVYATPVVKEYTIMQTSTAPIIDGSSSDSVWSTADWVSFSGYQEAGFSSSTEAKMKFLWDSTNLYVLVKVDNATNITPNSNIWQNNSLVICKRENDIFNTGSYGSVTGDKRIVYDVYGNTDGTWSQTYPFSTDYAFAQSISGSNFYFEYKIPFLSSKNANNQIRLGIYLTDHSTGGTKIMWNLSGSSTYPEWSDASEWGLFTLTGSAATETYNPTEDTSSNAYKNPAMGWQLYLETLDDGIPSDINAYFNSFNAAVRETANIIYIRCAWSELETSQGVYAWNDPNSWISKVEAWAVNNNKKLAFSVYTCCLDAMYCAVPNYVVSYPGITGNYLWQTKNGSYQFTPWDYDPIFQQLFETFLTAFAAKYDNPNLVDYIDANGLGQWGESHWSYIANYLTDAQKEQVYTWIINAYKSRFKKVLLIDNYVRDYYNGVDYGFRFNQRDWANMAMGYGMRRNSLGSPYVQQWQKDRLISNTNDRAVFGENYYHHFVTNPYWQYNYTTMTAMMTQVVEDAKYYHCNTLDLRKPEDANQWANNMSIVNDFNKNGGYRLVPTSITYPTSIINGQEYTISHSWKNTGVGMIPNNDDNWNYKYKVAFALLNTTTGQPAYIYIDNAEPSDWKKGQIYDYSSKVTFGGVTAGTYTLGYAIVDRDNNYKPAIKLGINNSTNTAGWYTIGNITVTGSSANSSVQISAKAYASCGQNSGSSINYINDGTLANKFISNTSGMPNYISLCWDGKTVTTDKIRISSDYAATRGITNLDIEYFDGKSWKLAAKNKSISWTTNTSTPETKEISIGAYIITNQIRIKINNANTTPGYFTLAEFEVIGKVSSSGFDASNLSPYAIASTTAPSSSGVIKNITDGNYATKWISGNITYPQDIVLDFNNNVQRVQQIKIVTDYGLSNGIRKVDVRYWNGNTWVDALLDSVFTYSSNTDAEEIWTLDFSSNNFAGTKIKISVESGSSTSQFAVNDIEVWGWGSANAPKSYDYARLALLSETVGTNSATPLYSLNDGDNTLAWASNNITFNSSKYIEVDFRGLKTALDRISLDTWYGQSQGITLLDLQYYDSASSTWKNAFTNRSISWSSNSTTIENRSINFDTVYTSKVRLIVRGCNTQFGVYAINELYLYGYVLK